MATAERGEFQKLLRYLGVSKSRILSESVGTFCVPKLRLGDARMKLWVPHLAVEVLQ